MAASYVPAAWRSDPLAASAMAGSLSFAPPASKPWAEPGAGEARHAWQSWGASGWEDVLTVLQQPVNREWSRRCHQLHLKVTGASNISATRLESDAIVELSFLACAEVRGERKEELLARPKNLLTMCILDLRDPAQVYMQVRPPGDHPIESASRLRRVRVCGLGAGPVDSSGDCPKVGRRSGRRETLVRHLRRRRQHAEQR